MPPILLRRLPVTSSVRSVVRSRQLSTSRVMLALKESAKGGQDNENRHEEIEYHKQDILQKHKIGKAHWKEELASDSESAIKADRGEAEVEKEVKSLQKETEKSAEEHKVTEGKQNTF